MNPGTIRLLKVMIAAVLCIAALKNAWDHRDNSGPFEGLSHILRFGLVALVLVLSFWSDRREMRPHGRYLLTSIGMGTLLGLIGLRAWTAWNTSSPTLIRAGQFVDFNGSSLDLKVDGRYRYCDIVFGETCCWGEYTIVGDRIHLVSDDGCKQGDLLFRTCTRDSVRQCLHWEKDDTDLYDMWVHEDRRVPVE